VKWLVVAVWAAFVVGGLGMGWRGLQNLSALERPRPNTVREPVAAPAPTPVAVPLPLTTKPPSSQLDSSSAPFEAAGPTDLQATPQPSSPAGRLTILLLGIDQRPDQAGAGGDPGRTDSMLLVSVEYDAHTASMVSIPRDSFVAIPGHGNDRVNAAYTFGEIDQRGSGPQLAKRTVAQVFGVPVDRYALVDIRSMEEVIDTFGGVWIDNPQRLVDTAYPTDNYRTITIDIPAGRQHMDGVTAVEYARTRHPDSDYGRQRRQQQVVLALRDQVMQLSVLPRLPQLLQQLLSLVRSDLTPVEIGRLTTLGPNLDRARDILTLPPNPQLTPSYTGPGGAAYIYVTPAFRSAVKTLIEQPRVAAERADIAVYNAGAPIGSGGRAADLLGRVGLSVTSVGNTQPQGSTRIEAGVGARETAVLVAKTLGVPASALVFDGDSSSLRILLGPDVRLPTG